ncbi:MAG: type II toxin-antitoxin system RelE/ParE family toxin [Helicobacteraceae bacterium]|nr:type II toxin-antitoxin system RelE/ParE family toxin [Helicobacteraceae bacterium]
MYQIEFVELDDLVPFEKFVNSITINETAKVFASFDKFIDLKNNNLPVKENLSKSLDDGIFEIRVSLPNKIVRSLYYYVSGKKIIITHGFIKKSQKTPNAEITKAKELRKLYNKRKSYD